MRLIDKFIANIVLNSFAYMDITLHCICMCIGFFLIISYYLTGGQWLSGRVLDSRPRSSGFEPHRRHCVVVLEQDTFILA